MHYFSVLSDKTETESLSKLAWLNVEIKAYNKFNVHDSQVNNLPGRRSCAQGLRFSFQEPPLSFQRHQGMNI